MKKTISYKIWQIFYPIGIYYVVSSLVFFALEFMIGNTDETYMLRQLLCAAATIPFLFSFYRESAVSVPGLAGSADDVKKNADPVSLLLAAVAAGISGIVVNNVIAMTPLIQASARFSEANKAFFGGRLLYELLGSCLFIPVAEELLFRGVVYRRLRSFIGVRPALAASALLFGLVHANVVQFLYAGILGFLLAYLLERTGDFLAPVLGHIAANLAAVARQETGWLAFSYQRTAAGIGFTVGMSVLAVGMFFLFFKRTERKRGQ